MNRILIVLTIYLLGSFRVVTPEEDSSRMIDQTWDIRLQQSSLDCGTQQICYELELQSASGVNWTLGDQNYRLFFDGDLMTVNTVTSLLPNSFYSPAVISQNVKITGQGQEPFSPLDDIDDNLGFLDFNIIQSDKSAPASATQILTTAYTPIAEICITVEPSVFVNDCVSFYHSRPSTAGGITTQYTTVSENDAPGSTVATSGNLYDDFIAANTVAACPGGACGCQAVAQTLSK